MSIAHVHVYVTRQLLFYYIKAAGFAQKIHPSISKEIGEYVLAGVTDVTEIRRLLRLYVRENVSKDLGETPHPSGRSLYPQDSDIRNHIHLTKKAVEFSKLDQENLRERIRQWKIQCPERSAFFRPRIASTQEDAENPASTTNGQTFLLVLQEHWQQELLQRYGNTICLLDATYKTTQYSLPLFFVCVRTNVGYIIVAEFIVETEDSEIIAEALKVIKSWNPKWNPPFFMVDYSEAEILALEAVFAGIQVYLCDFHREQAWVRWVNNTKHGLTKDEGQILLNLLRDCATAPPSDSPDELSNHYFHEAVNNLKASSVWKNHKAVRQWLQTTWLTIPQVS